jgi:hypothetical protein
MFRLMKLKPPHGWSAVGWELVIVTIGVLIALAAQQAIDSSNRRNEAQGLRAALDIELTSGIERYVYRIAQDRCINGRLDQLEQWLEGWRKGNPKALAGKISAPLSGPAGTSVWQSRDPDVVAHLPSSLKLAYASLYDEIDNYEVQRLDERMTWFELAQFDRATSLSHEDMMRLQGLITRARWRAGNITDRTKFIVEEAGKLGIHGPAGFPAEYLPKELCQRIL